MIRKILLLTFILIISLGLSIAYHTPTTWLILQANLPKALSITNVQGKIWAGSADQIAWKKWQIDKPSWEIEWLPLLSQNVTGKINGHFFNGAFDGKIDVNQQRITANNGHYNNNIQNILDGLNQTLVSLGGNIRFNLKHLEADVEKQKIDTLTLTTIWEQATVTAPLRLKLGKITTKTKMVDTKIITEINSVSGDIDISGLMTVTQDQNFVTKLKLHPNSTLTNEIKLTLRLIGQEMPNGDFLINKKGNLRYLRF
jgi:general secretion pathway protein N